MRPFDPPLINSANPWATTKEDLQTLYDCPYTGAVTTRTSTLRGFEHDDNIHQYCFFDADHDVTEHSIGNSVNDSSNLPDRMEISKTGLSSLNTLGYSPFQLSYYLHVVPEVIQRWENAHKRKKPFIFSVAGSASEVRKCCHEILKSQKSGFPTFLMELNLSCPNIKGKPPPAYSKTQLIEYFRELNRAKEIGINFEDFELGIKTPPYTHQAQFDELISALLESAKTAPQGCPISFITATNTLGNCLALPPSTKPSDPLTPAINSTDNSGIGGMAGAALHPLALGNVRKIRQMLDAHRELQHITIIGVGGVSDAAGYKRMRSVGAEVVAVGTAFGSEGVGVFEKIMKGLD